MNPAVVFCGDGKGSVGYTARYRFLQLEDPIGRGERWVFRDVVATLSKSLAKDAV